MVSEPDKRQLFICIVDISHFTEFAANSQDSKGAYAISVLLQGIVDANQLGFEIAEIEGDAVFFYREDNGLFTWTQLKNQCDLFYTVFAKKIHSLSQEGFLSVGSIYLLKQLGIKVILHHGQGIMVNIQERVKPMGQAILEAHTLLKNSIQSKSYALLTQQCLNALPGDRRKISDSLRISVDKYEHVGKIEYYYTDLDPDVFLPGEQEQHEEGNNG